MNRKLKQILVGLFGISLTAVSFAGYKQQEHYYDYARVTKVHPIIETVQLTQPVQKCWNRPDRHHSRATSKSYTPEIFGAVLGAAVGNQFGHGRGKVFATVAGAALGGSIAHDVKRQSQYRVPAGAQQRCTTVHRQFAEERIVGYRVNYHYKGQTFRTRTSRHPGKRIKVKVSVAPVEHPPVEYH